MQHIIDFVRNWTLPLAIVIGTAGFPVWGYFSFLLPYLIFTMLLFTFCRIPFSEIRFNAMHLCLLALQLGVAILACLLVKPLHALLAEAIIVLVIAPTGTAAAVITRKLGGNAASLTSFTILSNLTTAITAPLLFPLIHPAADNPGFLTAFLAITWKVFPLLILPFLLAMLLRHLAPALNEKLGNLQECAFYLWCLTLVITVAKTVNALVHHPNAGATAALMGVTALIVCILQFVTGKQLGKRFFHDRITAGQALGQKNAVLSLWMADTWLTPLVSVAASAYLVSQNLFNAWQLWIRRKKEKPASKIQN